MNWLVSTLLSSIGKKLMMAITGLCFIGFLTMHLIGNLTLYSGQGLFTSYARHLHALGPLITVAEWVLLVFAIIHILIGTVLFYKNLMARPIRYKINKNAGGRTIGSATQPYTGYIILAFIIIHLINFHFAEHTNESLYGLVSTVLTTPAYLCGYIFAMIVVGFHISHGFWSLFQTLGANHPKYMPFIRGLSYVFSIIIVIGFGFLPVYLAYIA